MLEQIAAHLKAQGLTVAVAEADTGGLVGSMLISIPGASRYFPGGVIAYARGTKTNVLGVPAGLLETHGAVSPEAALAMASRVRELFGTDLGLSTTGIAGPTGGSPERPVGLFYVALTSRDGHQVCREHRWQGDRNENRRQTADAALGLLSEYLSQPRERGVPG